MKDLTIISFYTPTWEYPTHARRLAAECEALGLRHHIRERADAGSYIANTRIKPRFIREAMQELGTPVLWVDVDGSILRTPTALRLDVDFMGRRMPPHRDRTWHVGTMFFNATQAARQLVDAWAAMQRGTDEAGFELAWQGWRGSSAELPANYFVILPQYGIPPDDCVICHRLSRSESKMEGKRRNG